MRKMIAIIEQQNRSLLFTDIGDLHE